MIRIIRLIRLSPMSPMSPMMNPRRIVSPLLGATLGVAFACTNSTIVRDPNHCFNADGDATCREKHGDDKPFCASGTCEPTVTDGCVPIRPDDDMCYSPCGGMKALADDPACEAVADSSSSAESSASVTMGTTETSGPTSTTSSMTGSTMTTTEASSSSGAQGCEGDDGCEGAGTPICIDQVCSPCESDAQCEGKDAARPACRDDGQCVQCTASNDDGCGGATPVCDAAASACVGCTFHEQCPESACRMATGECFDAADVVHVDADDGDNLGAEFVDGVVIVLHNYGTTTSYQVNLDLDGGVAAILAAVGDAPRIQGLDGGASITVRNGGELYVANGVQVILNGDAMYPGIAVDDAAVYVDRSRVVQNAGGGISLENGAYAQVRNSMVSGNGDGGNGTRGITCVDSDAHILYSSLVRNDADTDDSLACNAGSNVEVRNTLLLGRDPSSINCGATITYSVVDEIFAGTGNHQVAMLNNAWFGDVFSNDFTPTAMGLAEFGDVAQWNTGDPLIDIDGDARPGVDGSADVAGADIP